MGNDVALALFSENAPSLFSYFKQRFAQVTNPAIDPVREYVVMSLRTGLGPEENLLEQGALASPQLVLEQPVLSNEEAAVMRALDWGGLRAEVLDMTWPIADGPARHGGRRSSGSAPTRRRRSAAAPTSSSSPTATLDEGRAAIPSLLATSAVHQHLVRSGDRVRTGLAVETGEPREVHHVAALIGYGASAINPYVMLDTVAEMADQYELDGLGSDIVRQRAVLGAQHRPPEGPVEDGDLDDPVVQRGADLRGGRARQATSSTCTSPARRRRSAASAWRAWPHEALARHARAFPQAHGLSRAGHVESALLPAAHEDLLPQGGVYAWRRDGERHMWDPETISTLQRAAHGQRRRPRPLRGLRRAGQRGERPARADPRAPPDAQAEPAGAPRRGRAHPGDRQAVLDRGDEPGRPLAGGARDARDRDEPHRRPLELRRGRRGPAALRARARTATGAARRSSRSPRAASA